MMVSRSASTSRSALPPMTWSTCSSVRCNSGPSPDQARPARREKVRAFPRAGAGDSWPVCFANSFPVEDLQLYSLRSLPRTK